MTTPMASEWVTRGNLTGPQGPPGSDANVDEHENATDPHPQYLTEAEGDTRYAAGTDPRLTNARTPTAHAASHAPGGADALTGYVSATAVGAVSGVASLDSSGKIPQAQLPAIALTEFLGAVASQAAMLALTGQRGDWCTRTDLGQDFQLIGEPSSTLANWRAMTYPASPVTSVNGRQGAVTGLAEQSGVDTAIAGRQPLDADLTAIAALAPADGAVLRRIAGAWSTSTIAEIKAALALAKADVGLGNVDNTSDLAKPISTATQTALNGKVNTNDSRLADARTPTAHAASHAPGGSDALTGYALAGHTHASVQGGFFSGVVPSGATIAVITHNLGTQDVDVTVREVATGLIVSVPMETKNGSGALSDNHVRLTFNAAPTSGQYRVTILSAAAAAEVGPHQHDAADIATGTLSVNRMPRVTNPVATGSVASSLTSDASSGGSLRDVTVTSAAVAIGVPTNPANRQILRYAFYAQVATTVTFDAGIRLSTGIASRAFAIPQGQVLLAALEYVSFPSASPALPGMWVLTAATVSAS